MGIALFANLERPQTHAAFFDHVAEDVDWTVQGTHPLAGRYHSKQAFIEATFTRLAGVLADNVRLHVDHVYVDGDTAILELEATSTANDAGPVGPSRCAPADQTPRTWDRGRSPAQRPASCCSWRAQPWRSSWPRTPSSSTSPST